MNELYEGRQFVGMDLHRRRSVLVRMTQTGELLETVRILNDRDVLAAWSAPNRYPSCSTPGGVSASRRRGWPTPQGGRGERHPRCSGARGRGCSRLMR